jgi:hypothetical protein
MKPLPLIARRILLLGSLLAATVCSPACTHSRAADDSVKEQERAKDTIKLVVDYGDGVQKQFAALLWTKETTVLSVLEAAARHPRGIKFTHQGKGETVLVTAIDDLKNEGRGRNWLYEVNGKLGDRSCAVMPVQAGDSVLWRFGKDK